MQHFPATARRTVEVGMALRHHAASLSKFLVTVHRPARLGAAGGAAVCFATPDPEREAQSEPQLAVIVGGIMQGQDRDDIEVGIHNSCPCCLIRLAVSTSLSASRLASVWCWIGKSRMSTSNPHQSTRCEFDLNPSFC